MDGKENERKKGQAGRDKIIPAAYVAALSLMVITTAPILLSL